MHLRRCLICDHVGGCDTSPRRHATAHLHASSHPLVASGEPGQWAWCHADELVPVPR